MRIRDHRPGQAIVSEGDTQKLCVTGRSIQALIQPRGRGVDQLTLGPGQGTGAVERGRGAEDFGDQRGIEAVSLDDARCAAMGRPVDRRHRLARLRPHSANDPKSTPEELFRRLRHDANRPLLQVADPLTRLRDLFAVRDPLYREVAHFVLETGRPSVSTLVNMIVMQLELAGLAPPSQNAASEAVTKL